MLPLPLEGAKVCWHRTIGADVMALRVHEAARRELSEQGTNERGAAQDSGAPCLNGRLCVVKMDTVRLFGM